MEVHFIKTSANGDPDDFFQIVGMDVIPRIGETITFVPQKSDENSYMVESVDYSIKDKGQYWIRIWIRHIES